MRAKESVRIDRRFILGLILITLSILVIVFSCVSFAHAYSEPVYTTVVHKGDKISIVVSNWPRVLQGHVYFFELRAFDYNQVTKGTTPLEMFTSDQGDLSGVSINATLYNYDGSVLHKFSGVTNQFGWFEGSVLMENELTGQNYKVVFNATYPHMVGDTKTFGFYLLDQRDVLH